MNNGDILGHEFCGVVDEVGSEAKGIKKGGRYVASFQIACGDCFYCDKKLSSQCERTNSNSTAKAMYGGQTAGMFGYSHFTGGFAGGQAEYVRVPLADVNLLPIPDDVPDEKALYLSDVLATSYNAVKDTAVYPNDEVAIFGAGPIGQMAGIFAVNEGASKIIFVDTEPRLSLLKSKWPAEHQSKLELVDYKTLSFGVTNKPTVVSRLKELCGGRGPDVALECAAGEYAKGWMHWIEMAVGAETDSSEIVNEMMESVRNYGRCGVTGVYVGYVSKPNPKPGDVFLLTFLARQTTSTLVLLWSEVFASSETARLPFTSTGTSCCNRSRKASWIHCRCFRTELSSMISTKFTTSLRSTRTVSRKSSSRPSTLSPGVRALPNSHVSKTKGIVTSR